ncbi:MAG: UPF0149 family protein [Chlorobiaceae bacterium]
MIAFDALKEPLSMDEMIELESFLISEKSAGKIISIEALDGFFTAIVIGPATVFSSEWIPFIMGARKNASFFTSIEETQKIMRLLMRYMNSLVAVFQNDVEKFVPIYECCNFENREEEDFAAASWAHGFNMAMELRFDDWNLIFDMLDDDGEVSELILAPILLLAGQEQEVHEFTAANRDMLKKLVGHSVISIYRFWLPYREKVFRENRSSSKKPRIIPFDPNYFPPGLAMQ